MDERQISEAVERAERALAGGDFSSWRTVMMTVFEARPRDEQWARVVRRFRPPRREGREHGRPDGRADGCA